MAEMSAVLPDGFMRAAVFKGEGRVVLEQKPVPKITDPHQVMLEVMGVGICGTDLHITEVPPRHPATLGVILGHEHCGRVVKTGDLVTSVKVGDHVAVDHNAGCGHCYQCRAGFPNACETVAPPGPEYILTTPGIFTDGALADYIVVPDYYCYKVPDDIPWHHLAIAEPIACAFSAVRKARPEVGETAVVLGAGPVGLLIISMLKQSGVRVISSEFSAYRRGVAKELGADIVVDPSSEDLEQRVRAETEGRGAHIVVDAAAGPTLPDCVNVARFGGRVVLFGHDESAYSTVKQALIMRKELVIQGVFLVKYTFLPALAMIEQKRLPLDHIISHVLPLEKVLEAHAIMRAGQALKIVIDPHMK